MKTSVIENRILKENVHMCEYDNGLKAFVIPKHGYTKKYATYATHYGSIDNTFIVPGEKQPTRVPDGIAHFLEHKLFETEDDLPVLEKFSTLGASANAYTSFDHTAYLFSCTENFDQSFKLLMDFVQSPYLTDQSVEKEKGIIEQEIRMYEDNPNWRVFFSFLDALYYNHPVKIDIAGTVESISEINKEVLYKCYNTFYHPSNMIVCVVGDVQPEWVFEAVQGSQKIKENMREIKRVFPDEPARINRQSVQNRMKVATPLFVLGFKENTEEVIERSALHDAGMKILMEMIFGKASNLYKQLYEDGLITSNFDADYTFEGGYSYSAVSGESKSPQEVYERVAEAVKSIARNGLSEEDFQRIRKMKLGSFIKLFNSVDRTAREFSANYFRGIELFDYIDVYGSISFDQICNIFDKHFIPERMALSTVVPG